MHLFFKEIKTFFKTNYYIFIIGIIAILPILSTQDIFSSIEVIIIFCSHLLADIFMSMMIYSFSKGEKLKGFIFQLIGSIIFLCIGIYSFIFHHDSIYLIPSLIYFPVVFKNIYEEYFHKNINFINFPILFIYGLILLIGTIQIYNISDISTIIQFIGVLFFAVILNIKDSQKMRIGGIITLLFMIGGGILKLYNEIIINDILNGATFSYTILPLVVLVGFIKNK